MNLLNAGSGQYNAAGWVNADVHDGGLNNPDIKVEPGEPYPFENNHFDAVLMSHVIEHIKWGSVIPFLKDMSRIAKPNAPMLIIGPDVHRTIRRWKNDEEPWSILEAVLEDRLIDSEPDPEGENQADNEDDWYGAAHYWNCHEERVILLLKTVGFTNIVSVIDQMADYVDGWQDPDVPGLVWPTVQKAPWQFALRFTNKG